MICMFRRNECQSYSTPPSLFETVRRILVLSDYYIVQPLHMMCMFRRNECQSYSTPPSLFETVRRILVLSDDCFVVSCCVGM
jgi:hypothetical protein